MVMMMDIMSMAASNRFDLHDPTYQNAVGKASKQDTHSLVLCLATL